VNTNIRVLLLVYELLVSSNAGNKVVKQTIPYYIFHTILFQPMLFIRSFLI